MSKECLGSPIEPTFGKKKLKTQDYTITVSGIKSSLSQRHEEDSMSQYESKLLLLRNLKVYTQILMEITTYWPMLRTILGKIHDKWGTINLVDELSKEIEVLSNDISNMPYIELIIKPLTLLLKYNFLIYQNKNLESMPDGDLPFKKYINLNIAKSLRLNWESFLSPSGKKDDLFGKPILLKTFTDIKDAKSIATKLASYDPVNPPRARDWDIEVIGPHRGGRDRLVDI
jgi:hypothetical protein